MSAERTTPAEGAPSILTGLSLALVLTAIPFALVAFAPLSRSATLAIVAIAAVAQMLVHLRFFLRISISGTPRANLFVLVFAVLLIAIMVGGSLWIMFDLHHRMMP